MTDSLSSPQDEIHTFLFVSSSLLLLINQELSETRTILLVDDTDRHTRFPVRFALALAPPAEAAVCRGRELVPGTTPALKTVPQAPS